MPKFGHSRQLSHPAENLKNAVGIIWRAFDELYMICLLAAILREATCFTDACARVITLWSLDRRRFRPPNMHAILQDRIPCCRKDFTARRKRALT